MVLFLLWFVYLLFWAKPLTPLLSQMVPYFVKKAAGEGCAYLGQLKIRIGAPKIRKSRSYLREIKLKIDTLLRRKMTFHQIESG